MTLVTGSIRKMRTSLSSPVSYEWVAGEQTLAMNQFLGQSLSLNFLGTSTACTATDGLKKVLIKATAIPVSSDSLNAIRAL